MAYQSLYRKYRPQTFSDVVGQGHVVRTLQNALASGRIAHGYLFTGTRGTAKTTIARLLAKALNCEASDRPVPEPCNRCEACASIAAGTCIDVIEMDAASHRGVADIEEVRKAVGYGPMQFRYKVFIIDEAHQLSSDAKDAFLKTLEEPPPGVVFVLATTEPQSIPITIRSRCQQFDFKRGSLADIAARLRYVLDSEGVAYAPEAVTLVARGAEGSYRDSLSLLEQVLAFAPERIGAADVQTVLGSLDAENLARLTDAIARRDAPQALALAGEILDAGKEARTLLKTLAGHFRDLLLVRVGGPAAASELTAEEATRLQSQAQAFTPEQLIRAMDRVNEAQNDLRWNNQHRLLVELTFLKLMNLGDAPAQPLAVAPIVFAPAPVPVSAPPAPKPAPVRAPDPEPDDEGPDAAFFAEDAVDEEDDYAPETVAVAEPESEPEPEPEKPVAPSRGLFDDEEEAAPAFDPTAAVGSLFDDPEPAPRPVAAPEAPPVVASELEVDDLPPPPGDEDYADEAPAPPVPAPKPVTVAPEPPPPAPPVEPVPEPELDPRVTLERVQQIWPRFLFSAEKLSMQASVMLSAALPTSIEGNTIILTFSNRANYEMMQLPKKQEFIRKLLARCLEIEDGSVPVRLRLDERAAPPPQRRIQRTKVRHDPLAALEALHEEPAADGPVAPPPSAWTPPPAPRYEPPADAAPPTPPPGYTAQGETPAPAPVRALDDPLIQEILTTFGGEIVG